MNANINERSTLGLSAQPEVIVCPKCQYKRTEDDYAPAWQCPSCGVAYNKAMPPSVTVTHQVISTAGTRGRRDTTRDELETVTPGAISLSLRGRIGRLRYLAFSWPVILLTGLLGVLAAFTDPLHKTSGMVVMIPIGILCLWMPLRLMALRMHDVNQSAKWLLALLLLPGVCAALTWSKMAALCAGIFWIVAFLLLVLPGSEGDNDYGPAPAANTSLVTVGACVFLVFTGLAVVGNLALMRSGKLNSVLSRNRGTAAEQVRPHGS